VGNTSPASDVKPDAEIFSYGITVEPVFPRDTHNDAAIPQLGKLGVGTLNLAP
jgi:hypothetical protein